MILCCIRVVLAIRYTLLYTTCHAPDIDECREMPGICDQFCYNRRYPALYTCRCDESGWTLEPDRKSCKPNDPTTPFLILGNKFYIRYCVNIIICKPYDCNS